jgi:hypothetical protein
MGTVTNQLWLFLQLAAAFGLNLGQFVQILEVVAQAPNAEPKFVVS